MSEDTLLRVILAALAVAHFYNHHIRHRRPPSKNKTKVDTVEMLMGTTACAWTVRLALYVSGVEWFNHTLPLPQWLRWVGVAVMLACFPLSSWTYRTLGAHFSRKLELRADHQLVNTGPYRYVRHPMYATLCLCAVGTCLLSANIFVLVSTCLVAGVILLRIKNEEAMLAERFGSVYETYRLRTAMLVPKLL